MKSALKSKTIWLNVLTGASTAAGTLGEVLPPSALPWVVLAQSIANVLLRYMTSTAIR